MRFWECVCLLLGGFLQYWIHYVPWSLQQKTARQSYTLSSLNIPTCAASSMVFPFSLIGFMVLKCLKQLYPFRTVPVTESTFLIKLVSHRPSQRFSAAGVKGQRGQDDVNVHTERDSSPQKERSDVIDLPRCQSKLHWSLWALVLLRVSQNMNGNKTIFSTACKR